MIHARGQKGFVDLFFRWNAQPVCRNRAESPEIDERGNGGIESTAGLFVCPLGVREQFMEEGRDGNRCGRKGCMQLEKFGIGAPMRKDSFGFFDLCRNVGSKFALIDGLVTQNLYRPSRAECLARQAVRLQGLFRIILTT